MTTKNLDNKERTLSMEEYSTTQKLNSNGKESQSSDDTKTNKDNNGIWKKVSIAGMAGILLGGGAAFAADSSNTSEVRGHSMHTGVVATHVDANGLHVAEVNDSLSFHDAFNAARSEVGPGGVFHWHGATYSTYLETEWDHMTQQEHNAFAQKVNPEVNDDEKPGYHSAQHHDNNHDTTSDHNNITDQTHSHDGHDAHQDISSNSNHIEGSNDNGGQDDVHIVGVNDVTLEDGSLATVGQVEVNGEDVYMIDVNHDGTFDYGFIDANHDGQIEENELSDISNDHITVSDITSDESNLASHDNNIASDTDGGIADNMPDYINDDSNIC
jgi:hypothetical protein